MMRFFKYDITAKNEGQSILAFLKDKGYSRGVIIQLKKTKDGILCNGKNATVNEILHALDSLSILLTEDSGSQKIIPIYAPLAVVYEDDDILVINKAAGMPTHPSLHHYEYTLANAAAAYLNDGDASPFVFRCINRLDKDTSGLTIIARHMLSACILGTAIKNRLIYREYLAIVQGLTQESGTICAPIGRKSDSIIERTVDFEKGENATTHYRRLKYENGLSLLSINLETGRTHQIRVHMQYIGHPLVGDFLYHPKSHEMNRQALHARYLQFTHPITNRPLTLEALVPDDFIIKPYQ